MWVASLKDLFYVDRLSLILLMLVAYIGMVVFVFSKKYMKGDASYCRFFLNLSILILSVMTMAVADHLLIFLGAWALTSLTLIKLMIHKFSWEAAKESGEVCKKFFFCGFVSIAIGFALLYFYSGEYSIQKINQMPSLAGKLMLPLILILMGAMVQTAIWPFHRWLMSSLNSPTPVSAIMHAGIINGGGFLIARFAPLYVGEVKVFNLMFILGLVTALVGTLWKLIQSDVKRMLACSTMGQMGFMLMQCGLGLFPAAIAHLCWHGMFKAYLFLGSGNSAREKKLLLVNKPTFASFFLALVCGLIAAYSFSLASSIPWSFKNTSCFLLVIAFIAGAQLALAIFQTKPFKKFFLAAFCTLIAGALYGGGVYFLDSFLEPLHLMQPIKLNLLHYVALLSLMLGWVSILFLRDPVYRSKLPSWMISFYVKALNQSQPHPKTITTHRRGYKYV